MLQSVIVRLKRYVGAINDVSGSIAERWRLRRNFRQVYYILNLFGKTFSREFIKKNNSFLQTVKIKIVFLLLFLLFIFTEKSLYFIGKHMRKKVIPV